MPSPNPDVIMRMLDDELVVFSEEHQEVFVLQGMAGFVWCLMEEGLNAAEIAAALADNSDLDEGDALTFVTGCFEQWSDSDIIQDSTDTGPADRQARPRQRFETAPIKGEVSRDDLDALFWHSVHTIWTGGLTLRMRFETAEMAEWVWPVFTHMETRASGRPAISIDMRLNGTLYELIVDGEIRETCPSIDELAPHVKIYTTLRTLEEGTYSLAFHAGGVVHDGRALIFPGRSGYGKTTLTATLIASGFGHMGDDAIIYDGKSRVTGIPIAMPVKPGSVGILEPLYPGLSALPIHHRPDDKLVRYLAPPPQSLLNGFPENGQSFETSHIIFSRYAPGTELTFNEVPRKRALQRMMTEAYSPYHSLTIEECSHLIEWISNVECRELVYSSLDEAIALLRSL